MLNTIFFNSVLEQFEILPIIPLNFFFFDFSITNETIILVIITLFFHFTFQALLKPSDKTIYVIPGRFQAIIELLFKLVINTVINNIDSKNGQVVFPIVFVTFLFVLSANLIGLIPYSFTITSHLIVTFALSFVLFVGTKLLCVSKHGFAAFTLFMPSGTQLLLSLLLTPVEVISFIFKPISLATRLFANMMAGHTLLKVIAGFAFTLMNCTGVLFLLHFVPLFLLFPLFALEMAVAIIQALVFSILFCIYLADAIHLH